MNDGLPKWTYSDAVWFVSPEGEIFPARMETTDNGDFYDAINNADAVGKMTFENIYTRSGSSHTTPDEKPTSSPKTFDAGHGAVRRKRPAVADRNRAGHQA